MCAALVHQPLPRVRSCPDVSSCTVRSNVGCIIKKSVPSGAPRGIVPDWKVPSCCLVIQFEVIQECRLDAKLAVFADSHLNAKNGIRRTPKGLTFVSEWGSCRHAAGAAAILAVYARGMAPGSRRYAQDVLRFARHQVLPLLLPARASSCAVSPWLNHVQVPVHGAYLGICGSISP